MPVGIAGVLYLRPSCSWGTQWRSWLRHCATNSKVSVLDGVIGIFHFLNPGHKRAKGSTCPLTEMSIRVPGIFLGGKGGQCVGLTT
jgi:hypothetical protein